MANPRFPILRNHDPDAHVGYIDDGIAYFPEGVPEAWTLYCGWQTLKWEMRDGVRYILEAKIIEFSLCPPFPFDTPPRP